MEVIIAGTKAGGAKAAATNKAKYGADYYAKIGQMGGQNSYTGGFAANPELARIAGRKGGRISRRSKATHHIYYTVYDDQNRVVKRYKQERQAIALVYRMDAMGKSAIYRKEKLSVVEVEKKDA